MPSGRRVTRSKGSAGEDSGRSGGSDPIWVSDDGILEHGHSEGGERQLDPGYFKKLNIRFC